MIAYLISKILCHTNASESTTGIFSLDGFLSKPRNEIPSISSRQALRSIANSRVFGFCLFTYSLLNHYRIFVASESSTAL